MARLEGMIITHISRPGVEVCLVARNSQLMDHATSISFTSGGEYLESKANEAHEGSEKG